MSDPQQPQYQAPPAYTPPPQPKSRFPLYAGLGTAGLLIAAAAIITPIVIANNAAASELTNAAEECLNPVVYTLMDDGQAIEIPSAAKSGGATAESVFCFLQELDAPESIETKIAQTRSLDGTRETNWGDYTAQWTYHPDDGLNLLVERTK